MCTCLSGRIVSFGYVPLKSYLECSNFNYSRSLLTDFRISWAILVYTSTSSEEGFCLPTPSPLWLLDFLLLAILTESRSNLQVAVIYIPPMARDVEYFSRCFLWEPSACSINACFGWESVCSFGSVGFFCTLDANLQSAILLTKMFTHYIDSLLALLTVFCAECKLCNFM